MSLGAGGPSLFCGGLPQVDPFSCGFSAVLDLTRGAAGTYRAEMSAAAVASSGALLYLNAPLGDRSSERKRLLFLLRGTVLPFLRGAWAGNHRILVHCREGKSRGPACAAALLMSLHFGGGAPLFGGECVAAAGGVASAALAFVSRARAVANPNKGFRSALLQLQVELETAPVEALV
jgi:hypothetical protein